MNDQFDPDRRDPNDPDQGGGGSNLLGAAVGAVAGAVLPVVSIPIGLLVGAGFMLYKRLRP